MMRAGVPETRSEAGRRERNAPRKTSRGRVSSRLIARLVLVGALAASVIAAAAQAAAPAQVVYENTASSSSLNA